MHLFSPRFFPVLAVLAATLAACSSDREDVPNAAPSVPHTGLGARGSIVTAGPVHVVYVDGDPNADGQTLYSVDRRGTKRRLSPAGEPGIRVRQFRVSHDGRRVVFERYDADGRLALWLVDIDGDNQRNITGELAYNGNWNRWSADSAYFAFVARPSRTASHQELYVIAADANTPVRVSAVGTTDDIDNAAAASGDVANLRVPDGIPDSAGIAADGEPRGRVIRAAWSPTNTLAFVAEVHGGLAELYTVRPDGSGLRLRFDLFRDEDGIPGFDFDGADADGLPDTRIATSNNQPRWSPDGRTLAFALHTVQGAPVAGHVFTVGIDDETPTLRLVDALADMPSPRGARRLAFSPDSAYLLVLTDRDFTGVIDLFSEELSTGTVRKVGRADLDLFPLDGFSDTSYNGDIVAIEHWIDDRRFVYSADSRRDDIFELFVGRVDQEPTSADDFVVLTDVFSVDWDDDGQPDFDPDDFNSKPAANWAWPESSAVDGERVIVSARLGVEASYTVYAMATDGGDDRLLYELPLGKFFDALEPVGPNHSYVRQYEPHGADSAYEVVLVPHAGGEARPVVDLFADTDGDGVGDFDTDGDGYPNYSVEAARCVDAQCEHLAVVVRGVQTRAGLILLTEPGTGAITTLSDVAYFGGYEIVARDR